MELTDMRFNRKQKEAFVKELASNRLSHAYIIEGAEGSGKYTFARFAAAAILCGGENKPCGKCPDCVKLLADSHPDLFVFAPEKDAQQLTVNVVREIKKSIYLLPNEGAKKVYIIRDGQKMNVQAQNALLKFFEEPPESAVLFVLTDKREALLPTVISRGQIITLYPASPQSVEEWLAEKFPRKPKEEITAAAKMCEGSPGKALTLLEKRFSQIRADAEEYAKAVFERSGFKTVSFFKTKKYDRAKAKDFLLTLFSLFSDVLRAKERSQNFVILERSAAETYARLTTERKITALAEKTLSVYEEIDANANINLALTSFGAAVNTIQ
ncbi:MAG: DNA polymerase III subunit [Clostridia bacterium]|nr:DNA polymerase III subunit [Clostridia bacterium]